MSEWWYWTVDSQPNAMCFRHSWKFGFFECWIATRLCKISYSQKKNLIVSVQQISRKTMILPDYLLAAKLMAFLLVSFLHNCRKASQKSNLRKDGPDPSNQRAKISLKYSTISIKNRWSIVISIFKPQCKIGPIYAESTGVMLETLQFHIKY